MLTFRNLTVTLGFLVLTISLYLLIRIWRIISSQEQEQEEARQRLAKIYSVPEAH
jgi:hypothetical protein